MDLNGDGKPDLLVENPNAGTDGGLGVLLNSTPFCTAPPVVTISVAPTSLWPPNGKMAPVTISGTITDTGCSVTNAAYVVTDEYGEVQPMGAVTLGGGGVYSFTILLQASRHGTDLYGRLYTITVSASNDPGKTGSSTATVIVPHNRRH
jgi:type 1 fimbria pilin